MIQINTMVNLFHKSINVTIIFKIDSQERINIFSVKPLDRDIELWPALAFLEIGDSVYEAINKFRNR